MDGKELLEFIQSFCIAKIGDDRLSDLSLSDFHILASEINIKIGIKAIDEFCSSSQIQWVIDKVEGGLIYTSMYGYEPKTSVFVPFN